MTPQNDNAPILDLSVHLSGEHFSTMKAISPLTVQFITVLSAAFMAAELGVEVAIVSTEGDFIEALRKKLPEELYPRVSLTHGEVLDPPSNEI